MGFFTTVPHIATLDGAFCQEISRSVKKVGVKEHGLY
jgi:hypothetical protein